MSESGANSQGELSSSPNPNSGGMSECGKLVADGKCGARVGGGKTTTVFGALFGAAAAVPT
jgi:hypothetical protein